VFSLAIMRQRLLADTLTPALVLACAAIAAGESRPVAQKFPSNGAVGADQRTSVEILTPTEGVDFNGYVTRLIKSVRHNWYAIMPEAARKGEKGKVSVRFHIQQNGTLLAEEPKLESGSAKGPLDRAAVAAIRGSMPFEHLPAGFRGPNIELRVIFLYNLGPESKAGTSDASP
jgi:TonB family protein